MLYIFTIFLLSKSVVEFFFFVTVKENTNGRPQPLLQEPHYGSRPQPYSKLFYIHMYETISFSS